MNKQKNKFKVFFNYGGANRIKLMLICCSFFACLSFLFFSVYSMTQLDSGAEVGIIYDGSSKTEITIGTAGSYTLNYYQGTASPSTVYVNGTSKGTTTVVGTKSIYLGMVSANSVITIKNEGVWTFNNYILGSASATAISRVDMSKERYLSQIGNCAFYGCTNLTGTLTIPSSVTTIGYCAFCNCSNLTGALAIPSSVTEISWGAFSGCSGFTGTLAIPSSVTSVMGSAFKNCSGFTGTLSLPSSLTTINDSTFEGCSGLDYLIVPNSVTSIGNSAFKNCSNLKGDNGAYLTYSQYLYLPGVSTIGNEAFFKCTSINSSLGLPCVTSIGNKAFSGCRFSSIVSMPLIMTVGDEAFTYTTTSSGTTEEYGAISLSYSPLNVCSSLYSIGTNAFRKCSFGTSSIVLPASITSLGNAAFSGVTAQSANLSNLTLTTISPSCFAGSSITSVTLSNSVTNIGMMAFANCESLAGVNKSSGTNNLPSSLTTVSYGAFQGCSALAGGLSIPSVVTSIGGGAFKNCSSLTGTINIPRGITTVESSTFEGCNGFSALYISALTQSVGGSAFKGCFGLTQVAISLGQYDNYGQLSTIGISAFEGCMYVASINNVLTRVTSIGDNAFKNCTHLSDSINIYSGITSIGNYAFYGCSSISGIVLPSIATSFTVIGDYAFYGCSAATGTLTFATSVRTIGNYAFSDCTNITGISLGSSLQTIGNYAFCNIKQLASMAMIIIPSSVSHIGIGAFYGVTVVAGSNYIYPQTQTGWYVTTNPGYTGGTSVSVNMTGTIGMQMWTTYLTSTYANYYWYR